MLVDIVKSCFEKAQEQQKAEGCIKFECGFATIPLPGIDLPFHSRYLWAGVLPFHACMLTFSYDESPFELIFFPPDLSKKINPSHLNPDMLVGKYIPSLIVKPFNISREYALIIYDQTCSPNLDKVLKRQEQEKWSSAEKRQKLAYIILVELLAYQFASPVRWIQTQDLLFTTFNFERLVELGPSPTLTGMATRTLKSKYETLDGSVSRIRSNLCYAKNVKEIYYQYEDEIEMSDVTVNVPISAMPAVPITTSTAVSTPTSGPVAVMEDIPIKAIDILLVIVAQKLKKRLDETSLSKSTKDLVFLRVFNHSRS